MKTGKTNRSVRRRAKLWRADPRCHWCHCMTVLPEHLSPRDQQYAPSHMATLDHLRSRANPRRHEPKQSLFEERTVLACHKCNTTRSNDLRQPGISPRAPFELIAADVRS